MHWHTKRWDSSVQRLNLWSQSSALTLGCFDYLTTCQYLWKDSIRCRIEAEILEEEQYVRMLLAINIGIHF